MEWLERLHCWLRGSRPRSRNTRRQGWRKPQFMALEPRLLMTGAHLDLGTATSPPATGYVSVPVVAYTPQLGYGWTSTKGISAVDRGTSNDLTRAFQTGTNGTFEISLPNGTYQVTPTLGDATAPRDVSNLYLEGRSVASNLDTQAGQFTQPTYNVKVTNGLLTVRLLDSGSATKTGWALDGIDVVNNATSPGVPTATLTGAPTTAEAGAAITIGSTVTDPNGPTSGFTYAWSVTKNGSAFTSASGALPSFTFTPDAAATYVVKLQVTDAAKQTSTPATALIAVSSVASVAPPRPDALGPYTGSAGVPVQFVGIAQIPKMAPPASGFTYTWSFGDGTTATGATPDHTYAQPGQYTVTFTAADSGGAKSTTTTATVGSTAATGPLTDFQINATNLLANVQWSNSSSSGMAADGAWGVNAQWEQGTSKTWYIEEQRYGEYLIINGLLHNNATSIAAGFKAFNWGFAHQAADGSFAGTGDPFHSTSFFVEGVAEACLLIEQSPFAQQYQAQVNAYIPELYKAAQWMTTPTEWARGIADDAPYTHRRYLVADALGFTSLLVGGDSNLMALSHYEIQAGLSLQQPDGVNPELGGHDSSYQTVGLSLAERWTTFFPNDSLTPAVQNMINKGLAWEETMILPSGQISTVGNTRVGSGQVGPSGTAKDVNWEFAADAFAYWYQVTGNARWQADAQQISQYYFQSY